MRCQHCGQRMPRARTPDEHRRYQRVFMRATRRAVEFAEYLAANVAAKRAGRPCDEEAVEVAMARDAA